MADEKSLIASSEFDPGGFVKGIDAMTAALQKLSAQEDELRADMANVNTALKANRTEYKANEDQIKNLDKTAKTYADDLAKLSARQAEIVTQNKALRASLTEQKAALADINTSANNYKNALTGLAAVSKQVAQEGRGRTLFDVASLNAQVQEISELGGRLRNIFQGRIDTDELDRFEQAIAGAGDEMQQLAQIVTFVKGKLDTLDPNSQEFADLTRIIEVGDQVLEQFGKTVEDVDKKGQSLRGRLTQLRTELVNLEEQGKENTEEFQKLQIEAGQLQDAISDAQQRIKVLSSDTRHLDFGIGVIRGAVGAFGVFEGAATLAGIRNEALVESIQRLNGVMLLLNGLQEIQNLLQKQSVVTIVGQEIATKGAAIAQRIFAVAVGTSTGALRAFRIALLATGIGAFVVLLGVLTDGFGLFSEETERATTTTDDLTESIKRQDKALADLNSTLDFNSKVRIENLKQSGATDEQIFQEGLRLRQEQLKANKDALEEARFQETLFQDESRRRAAETQGDISKKEREESNKQRDLLAKNTAEKEDLVQNSERDLTLFVEQEETRRFEARGRANKAAADQYRAFIDRLIQLQRELRDKTLAQNPEDELNIRQQFANELSDLTDDIDRDVKSGKLSKQRGAVLKNLVAKINTVDLEKALREFNDQVTEAQIQFDRQLTDLQLKNATDRANLIRDVLAREAAAVQAEFETQAEALETERDDIITSINQTRDEGLISPAAAAENIRQIETIYAQLLENLAEQTVRKQEEITARAFEASQRQLQALFSEVQLIVSEEATQEIIKLSEAFTSGAITYEQYQKELTRISKQESDRRIKFAIQENEALLVGIQARIQLEQDPERRKALQDQERQLRATLSDLKRQLAQGEAEEVNQDNEAIQARIERIATYAQAVNGIIQSVVGFWQQANEAEARALERSISLQERRVEAATRIAERGNAEYLRLEEDRLNELQVKQENAARRQLAINAVVQTSQALTAFITALSQGIATGGPLGGIAIATAVIGLIASGYAIISNLQQNNRLTLFKGTKRVRRDNGEPPGVDTVPAMLTENEAVIPAETNRKYAPAVEAIYDQTVPAEEMNAFVNNYRVNRRALPRLNHEKMGEVAEISVTYDGQLLQATREQTKKLGEQAELLERLDKRLANMGISASIDKHGLAISLLKATEKFAIDKKV